MKTIKWALLSLFLLAGCWTRPPEDVRADRDRWTFYRDALADKQVSQSEGDLSDTLLADWNTVLLVEEKGTADLQAIALDIAMGIGDALLRTDVTDFMRKRYPDVFPIFDVNEDGVLTLDELRSINPRDPKVWVGLLFALRSKR